MKDQGDNTGKKPLAANVEEEAANHLADYGYKHEIRWRGKMAVLYVLDTQGKAPRDFQATSIVSIKSDPELARREIYQAVIAQQFPGGHPEIKN